MKQQFCRANIGKEFPVLWEGYSEAVREWQTSRLRLHAQLFARGLCIGCQCEC